MDANEMYKKNNVSENKMSSASYSVTDDSVAEITSYQLPCKNLHSLISILCRSQTITRPVEMKTLLQEVDQVLSIRESVICIYKTSNCHKIYSISSKQSELESESKPPILHNLNAMPSSNYTLGDWTVYCVNFSKEEISCFYCMYDSANPKSKDWMTLCEIAVPHMLEANRKLHTQTKQFDKFQLTSREQEVMHWIIEGKDNWSISKILDVSERTIKFHNCNIYRKLGVKTKNELICSYYQATVTSD